MAKAELLPEGLPAARIFRRLYSKGGASYRFSPTTSSCGRPTTTTSLLPRLNSATIITVSPTIFCRGASIITNSTITSTSITSAHTTTTSTSTTPTTSVLRCLNGATIITGFPTIPRRGTTPATTRWARIVFNRSGSIFAVSTPCPKEIDATGAPTSGYSLSEADVGRSGALKGFFVFTNRELGGV